MTASWRRAGRDDIPLLVSYRIRQLHDEGPHPEADITEALYAWFEKTLSDGTLFQIVWEKDGDVISTGAFQCLPMPVSFTKPTGRIAYVTNMYTLPQYRGQGYAKRTLRILQKEAERQGMDRMMLHASVLGKGLYESFGFTCSDSWMELIL